MLKNYLKTAIAKLLKSRVYSLVSISSLSIGLAVCILLLLYVTHELSYDRYHTKADNIYRLCQPEHPYQAPGTGKYLMDNLPEIESFTRILPRDEILVTIEDKLFKEDFVAWTDAELFDIFSFEFVKGSRENSLKQPWTAVLTEKTARKYFGDENAIGKIFNVGNEYDYTVVGVIKDIPQNSHFTFDLFLTLADGNKMYGEDWEESWGWWNFLVYFDMSDNFVKPDVEAKITGLMEKYNFPDAPKTQFTLQNLKDIHLHSSHFLGDIQPQNSISYVLIFSAIGLLILLIACFNYINLLTANATTRGTEIGIRKTFGASRAQLAMQYITESMVVFFISFCIALILVRLSLPVFNEISGKDLSFSFLANTNTILSIVGMMLVLGILAGWYPAFVLSSYNPGKVMKTSKSGMGSGFQIKKILIGAQFTIVIALIACSAVMLKQIRYIQEKDLGFDKEAVITAIFDFGDEAKYNTLKQALLNESYISGVSVASRIPSGSLSNEGRVTPVGQTEALSISYVHVTFDYFRTLGIKPVKGRLFDDQFKTDETESIILNQAAVAYLNLMGDPVGQALKCNWPKSTRKVVGVVDDINFEMLYLKVKPVVYVIDYSENYHIIVKVKPSDMESSISGVTQVCQSMYPDQVIEFSFLDQILEQRYQKDSKTFKLMGFFAVLAIILASMGLFGMASFIMTSRTKEIGIRKVNGATVSEIIQMLNLSFVKWMIFAFVMATPIAFYVMNKWLESFAYKTVLSWWIFLLAGLISLIIVLLTVSSLTYKAARRNPVEALRYE
ncbi:MAG: ABC transporter permease [Bacteroidales bacterium]|nr:ABC transporter permease [Bacteroidales bacterium]MCF8390907.1 ABC transporter permease [Bacteroidales bacterium]